MATPTLPPDVFPSRPLQAPNHPSNVFLFKLRSGYPRRLPLPHPRGTFSLKVQQVPLAGVVTSHNWASVSFPFIRDTCTCFREICGAGALQALWCALLPPRIHRQRILCGNEWVDDQCVYMLFYCSTAPSITGLTTHVYAFIFIPTITISTLFIAIKPGLSSG
jgi:hypothetical protein